MKIKNTRTLLHLEIPGLPPTVNHTYRTGKNFRYKVKEVRDWQEKITLLMRNAKTSKEIYGLPVSLSIIIQSGTKRRWDLDNRIKALQDCLAMAEIIKDDSQVWEIFVRRTLNEPESTWVHLTTLDNEKLSFKNKHSFK